MKCLVCTCFDVSSFFGTVENLGWKDVERADRRRFLTPPVQYWYRIFLQLPIKDRKEILSTYYSTVSYGGTILSTYDDKVEYGRKIEIP